jgi:S-adenosylmethionine:tRNA ribosyltransferase-isomerase
MSTIPQIAIEEFTYHLPESQIASYPLENRDDSKLLIYENGIIEASSFKTLSDYLPANSRLVFNNTKVIRARLIFKKKTGATIEVFCLEPAKLQDIQEVFSSTQNVQWKCIVGNLKRWKDEILETSIAVNGISVIVSAQQISRDGESVIVEFSWDNKQFSFGEILDQMGTTPIPPYLNRSSEDIDTVRYQTVYSQYKGSVAAPTAGLHFTEKILTDLQNKGFQISQVTLHVGAGTFKPVKSETIDQHEMHSEYFKVETSTIEDLLNHNHPIIAVGTTTVRTLESLFWSGVKVKMGMNPHQIAQWDPYQIENTFSVKEALDALLEYLNKKNLKSIDVQTSIMIAPGYNFRIIDGLITNFHQPQSTLLLLISALIGDDWRKIYDYAINNQFRFLSYGDSSLLLKPRT